MLGQSLREGFGPGRRRARILRVRDPGGHGPRLAKAPMGVMFTNFYLHDNIFAAVSRLAKGASGPFRPALGGACAS